MIWTLIFAAEVCAFIAFIGWDAATSIPWGVWFGGVPLSQQRFYGAILLHPDARFPRSGTWEGVVFFLRREWPYHGRYRRIGAWMLIWTAPRSAGAADLALGGASL